MFTKATRRDDVLTQLDDFAAVGAVDDCLAYANDYASAAAEARCAESPAAGWLERVAEAARHRAEAIQRRLNGDGIQLAYEHEQASERVLGKGPGDILTSQEIESRVEGGIRAFWSHIRTCSLGDELFEAVTVEQDAALHAAARSILRGLVYGLAEEES